MTNLTGTLRDYGNVPKSGAVDSVSRIKSSSLRPPHQFKEE